jgi:hypothetical protein
MVISPFAGWSLFHVIEAPSDDPATLGQLGAYNFTAIVGFNAQLLEYFAVLNPLSVWHNRQNILAQPVSYLSREILDD